jgi:hypothetical protein
MSDISGKLLSDINVSLNLHRPRTVRVPLVLRHILSPLVKDEPFEFESSPEVITDFPSV